MKGLQKTPILVNFLKKFSENESKSQWLLNEFKWNFHNSSILFFISAPANSKNISVSIVAFKTSNKIQQNNSNQQKAKVYLFGSSQNFMYCRT
jgi:hypothetical protein